MAYTLHYNHSIGFVFRVLPEAYEVLEELVYVGHIEIARHNEIAVHPIVFTQERVHVLDAIFAKSAITHVSHNHFAYVREFSFLEGYIVFQRRVCFEPLVDALVDASEDVLHGLRLVRAYPTDVAFTRLHIEFDTRKSCSILSAVVLFFEHQVHFVDAIEGCTVFFFVKIKRFEQAD